MNSEVWLITRYDDARNALADPRLSKDPSAAPEWAKAMAGVGDDEGPMGRNMLNSDPPDHTRQRKLVNRAFTPRRVEALAPRIQQITDELLDAVEGLPQVDLMASFAQPLPITVICELLGIPAADRHDFAVWTRMLLASPSTEAGVASRREGNKEMSRYLEGLIAAKRPDVDPDAAEDAHPDLISALIAPGRTDGLDERELLGMIKLLLVAGHETTVNHIGNGMVALLRHPEQLRALQDRPGLLPGAVEEMLRYDGPIERVPMRFTTEDIEVGGTTIPQGSAVNVVLASADRDDTRFGDGCTFDITRAENPHMAFGYGIHYCVGAPLARLESRIAFSTLLDRFPDIALAVPPGELRWRVGGPNIMRGLDTLPVILGARRGARAPGAGV
ncbi:cytochrome P450 [Streptomyces sp. V4-01]|uniref:Cytochrome P450 n=1 Tax=Actinacidiphila polyblastidii TaxID=3110430 RepID=A0ABU7PC46_9ACTN|nr:cytochrome P450 [Streptomyces sp. V4-01]